MASLRQKQYSVLGMSTLSFAVNFAVWTMFSIIGIRIKDELGLSESQFGLMVALPILTGSLVRLPLGLITDRFGGRIVFFIHMLLVAIPIYGLAFASQYWHYLVLGLFVGLAGGSFAVGIAYTSAWFEKERQGTAMGIFCYPRIEAGQPTVCSETCVGRIRYLGVLLYDADRIHEVASCENERELYEKQLEIFLDPFDPAVIAQARKDGVADSVIEAAQKSPVYKLAMDWKLALPLHPEYRTLPMVWYVPPLSPIQNAAAEGHIGSDGVIPDVESLRIPVQYLANLLTAGDTAPVLLALKRLLAMRAYKRAEHVEGRQDLEVLAKVGLSVEQVEEMYRYLAIANYEDRFVIPSAHREEALSDAFAERSGCGFSFGNGCSGGSNSAVNLFGGKPTNRRDVIQVVQIQE